MSSNADTPEKRFTTFKLPDIPGGDNPPNGEYKLCVDINAFCDVEKETGINMFRAMLNPSMSMTETRALLCACLRTAFPTVTLKEAGSLLSRDMNTVCDAMRRCMQVLEDQSATTTAATAAATTSAVGEAVDEGPAPPSHLLSPKEEAEAAIAAANR